MEQYQLSSLSGAGGEKKNIKISRYINEWT